MRIRTPPPPVCDFCGAPLPDPMLGFMDHMDAAPACREAWIAWRENVRREAGGT